MSDKDFNKMYHHKSLIFLSQKNNQQMGAFLQFCTIDLLSISFPSSQNWFSIIVISYYLSLLFLKERSALNYNVIFAKGLKLTGSPWFKRCYKCTIEAGGLEIEGWLNMVMLESPLLYIVPKSFASFTGTGHKNCQWYLRN